VNEEALAHWGAVVPQTNKQTLCNTTSRDIQVVSKILGKLQVSIHHKKSKKSYINTFPKMSGFLV
jgi:hypothetical protein